MRTPSWPASGFCREGKLSRPGRSFRTGEARSIPVSKRPSFKADKALRDAMDGGLKRSGNAGLAVEIDLGVLMKRGMVMFQFDFDPGGRDGR